MAVSEKIRKSGNNNARRRKMSTPQDLAIRRRSFDNKEHASRAASSISKALRQEVEEDDLDDEAAFAGFPALEVELTRSGEFIAAVAEKTR